MNLKSFVSLFQSLLNWLQNKISANEAWSYMILLLALDVFGHTVSNLGLEMFQSTHASPLDFIDLVLLKWFEFILIAMQA